MDQISLRTNSLQFRIDWESLRVQLRKYFQSKESEKELVKILNFIKERQVKSDLLPILEHFK